MAGNTDALNRLTEGLSLHAGLLQRLNGSVEGLTAGLAAQARTQAGAARAAAAPGAGAGGGGGFAGGAGALLGGLASAATAATGAVLGLVAAADRFVSAFNPALVELFHQSLKDLQAALGSFLEPIVSAARGFAEQLNSVFTALAPALRPLVEGLGAVLSEVGTALSTALLPILDALRPAFAASIDAFGALASGLRPVLDVLVALAPIVGEVGRAMSLLQGTLVNVIAVPLRVLAGLLRPILEALAPLAEGLTTVGAALAQLVSESFGALAGLLQTGVLDVFAGVMVTATNAVRNFVNAVLQFLGLPQLRAPVPGGAGRTQAAGEARFIETLEIGRQARLAAAGAGGQGPATAAQAERQVDLLGGLLGVLRELPARLGQVITGALGAVGAAIVNAVVAVGAAVGQLVGLGATIVNGLAAAIAYWLQWAGHFIVEGILRTVPEALRPNNPVGHPGNAPPPLGFN